MLAWICSTIFHAKDTPTTEKLDYFSAMLYLLVIVYQAFVKVQLDSLFLKIAFGIFYACHITYLSVWRFDYGYNMKASIAVAVVSNVIWLAWCWQNRQRDYVWKMVCADH